MQTPSKEKIITIFPILSILYDLPFFLIYNLWKWRSYGGEVVTKFLSVKDNLSFGKPIPYSSSGKKDEKGRRGR